MRLQLRVGRRSNEPQWHPSEGTMPRKLQPRATPANQGSLEFTQTTWQTDARKSDPCVLTVLQCLDDINCWLSQNLLKLNDDKFDVLVIKSTTLTHSKLSLLSKNVKQSTHNQWFSTLSSVSMLKLKKMSTTLTPHNSECGYLDFNWHQDMSVYYSSIRKFTLVGC